MNKIILSLVILWFSQVAWAIDIVDDDKPVTQNTAGVISEGSLTTFYDGVKFALNNAEHDCGSDQYVLYYTNETFKVIYAQLLAARISVIAITPTGEFCDADRLIVEDVQM